MIGAETPLAMMESHVREGEERVRRQEQIVAEMDRDGHVDTAAMARKLLATFQDKLALSRKHLAAATGHDQRNKQPNQ